MSDINKSLNDLGIVVSKTFKPNAEETIVIETLIKKVGERKILVQEMPLKPVNPDFLQPLKHI